MQVNQQIWREMQTGCGRCDAALYVAIDSLILFGFACEGRNIRRKRHLAKGVNLDERRLAKPNRSRAGLSIDASPLCHVKAPSTLIAGLHCEYQSGADVASTNQAFPRIRVELAYALARIRNSDSVAISLLSRQLVS